MKTHEENCKSCIYKKKDQIDRRKFISKTATATAGITFLTFTGLIDTAFAYATDHAPDNKNGQAENNNRTKRKDDTKKIFLKKGACSTTFFYFLNLEYGHLKEDEEYAASCLAGGIAERGHQCGILWGSAMATGAEAYRRFDDKNKATAMTISSTQKILESFVKKADTVNCYEFTNVDLSKRFSTIKMLFTSAGDCFRLAEKFRPKAISASKEGLAVEVRRVNGTALSCASETAKKMGASEEEAMMVAGFAGGYGLSGNTCGALAAAIWMKALKWRRENPKKTNFTGKKFDPVFKAFDEATGSEYACRNICGRQFKTIDEHTEFVNNGGCQKLINTLANA